MGTPRLAVDLNHSTALMTSAPINVDTMGDNTLVAAVPGKIVRCYRLVLVPSAELIIQFEDGSSDAIIMGPMSLAANTVFQLSFDSQCWLETSAGNALLLNLSAGSQCGGGLFYVQQ